MEKTIEISGKKVGFKSTGSLMLRYKAQFGKDFLSDFVKLQNCIVPVLDANNYPTGEKNVDFSKLDTEVFFNIAWTMAKTSNDNIPNNPIEWLDEFDEFPILDVFTEIIGLINANLKVDRKNV